MYTYVMSILVYKEDLDFENKLDEVVTQIQSNENVEYVSTRIWESLSGFSYGKCVVCGTWVNDKSKDGNIELFGNGRQIDGRWYCTLCCPSDSSDMHFSEPETMDLNENMYIYELRFIVDKNRDYLLENDLQKVISFFLMDKDAELIRAKAENELTGTNFGRCAKCAAWASDKTKEDFVWYFSNGAKIGAEWYCDICLPKDHPLSWWYEEDNIS